MCKRGQTPHPKAYNITQGWHQLTLFLNRLRPVRIDFATIPGYRLIRAWKPDNICVLLKAPVSIASVEIKTTAHLVKRRLSNRKVADSRFDSWSGNASLRLGKDTLRLFTIVTNQ